MYKEIKCTEDVIKKLQAAGKEKESAKLLQNCNSQVCLMSNHHTIIRKIS